MLAIVLAHAKAVSWCTQLVISACKHADTILYSEQHAVTLLMASLSWLQHMFCCICQSIAICCQYFWRIFFNLFFCDPAIVGHIVPQPMHFAVQLVFFQNAFNFKCLFTCIIIKFLMFPFFFFFRFFWLLVCKWLLLELWYCAASQRPLRCQ